MLPHSLISKATKALRKAGYLVEEFTEYHFRVEGRLNVFANRRGRSWIWDDMQSGERGLKPESEVVSFAKSLLGKPRQEESPEKQIEFLVKECGWSREEADKSVEGRSHATHS